MKMTEDPEPEYEFEPNTYEKFMRKHLQHYGYYTGRNQGYREKLSRFVEWEKAEEFQMSESSDSDSDLEEDEDKQDKQEEFLRTTQLIYSYEAGRMVPRLREPRNLYALAKELGPQQAARWPSDLQVLGSRIKHIRYVPPTPEKFYQPTGQENQPMVRGEEYGGRLVYEYETKANFFVRSCVGGTKNGYSICSVPLMSDQDRTLLFESRFESGNLAKVVQVGEHDYELWLRYDFYTQKHTQWFYFQVSNTHSDTPYRFTIVNFMKPDSLYNSGMKPLMYSQTDAEQSNIGWRRSGSNIKYYKNNKTYSTSKGEKSFYSLTWTVDFEHDHDVVFFAHCFPYTYSDLQDYLMEISNDPVKSRICKQRVLCRTLAGNLVYILTITSPSQNPQDIKYKRAVVITSRVHPGESNASWMMKGFLDYLMGNTSDAKLLRDTFVFKIVPMLNPDGVIVGNYRCSLSGRDLNRNYKTVLKDSFPPVWHTRCMIKRLAEEREIVVYCDLHGHSRKQNVFIYGCENRFTPSRRLRERIFPMMLHKNAPDKFSFDSCKFKIQKSKEGTGRVVMWNMGILNSFTMEATFCGSTLGKKKGQHFSVVDFEMMGYHFCDTLLDYCDPDNTKSANVFVELEERVKKEILVKLETQGMATEEIDLSQEYMFGLESTDGGSDSSASDGLPIHLQYISTQSDKKKKKLRSRKERDRQRGKSEEKKATASTQVQTEAKPAEKGGTGQCSSGSKQAKDRYDRQAQRNEYLEALTHTYLQNGVLLGPDSAPPHLRYSGNKLPAIPYSMEGLCPHHEQAMAAQYMSQQLRNIQPPGTLALVGYSIGRTSRTQNGQRAIIRRVRSEDVLVRNTRPQYPRIRVENAIEDFISMHIGQKSPERLSQKRHLLEIAVAREREQFIQGLKKKEEEGADNLKLSKSPLLEALPKPASAESDRGSLSKGRKRSVTPVKSESSQSACGGVDMTGTERSLSKLSGERTSDSDPYMQSSSKSEKVRSGGKGKKKQEEKSNQPIFPSSLLGSIPKQNAPLGTSGGFAPLAQSIIGEDKVLRKTPDFKHSKSHGEDQSNRMAVKLGHPSAKLKPTTDLGIRSDFHMVYPDPNIDVGITKSYKSTKVVTSRRAYTTESQLRQIELSRGSAVEGVLGSDSPREEKVGNTRGEKGSARSEKGARGRPASLQSPAHNRSNLTPTASQYIKRLMQEADEEISELTSELEEDVKRERRLMENLRRLDEADLTIPKPGSGLSGARLSDAIAPASPLDWAVGCVQVAPVKHPRSLDTNWNSSQQSSAESCGRKVEDHCQRRKDHCQRRESSSRMKSGKQGKRELLGTVPAKICLTISDGHGETTDQTARHFLPSSRPALRNSSKRH